MNNKDFTLAEQFSHITRLLFKERLRSFKTSGGPDAWRKRLLGLVKAHPGMTLKKLSGMLNHRMPAGEELLLGLEKKGYVAMKPVDGSEDKVLELTELGQKEAAEYPDLNGVFDVLSDEEKAAMSGFLTRITEELKKKAGTDENSGADPDEEWFAGIHGMCGIAGFNHMRKLHEYFLSRKGPRGRFWGGPDSHGAFGGCNFWNEEI